MLTEEVNEVSLNQELISIVAINKTEHKYYIYSENGLLVNRINYSKLEK